MTYSSSNTTTTLNDYFFVIIGNDICFKKTDKLVLKEVFYGSYKK